MIDTALCLLIGGESRRMGSDKAQLRLPSGKTLVELMVEKLILYPNSQIFLSGEKQFTGLSELVHIADIFTNKVGPVGAIISCSKFLADNFPHLKQMIMIPIDLPNLSVAALESLCTNSAEAAYFENHPLPLKLEINSKLLMVADELINFIHDAGGYSVRQFLAHLDSCCILPNDVANELSNFNFPEQWQNFIKNYNNG